MEKDKGVIITRKIQVRCEDVAFYEMLRDLNKKVFKMANRMMQKLYLADAVENELMVQNLVAKKAELKPFLYGKEGAMTEKSKQNIPYEVSAAEYSEVPSTIRAALASNVFAKFKTDAFDVSIGKKTQATFRFGMPIPFMKSAIAGLSIEGFTMFKHNILWVFGRDRSGNAKIVEGILEGKYDLCDSSISYEGKKTFVNLVVRIPKVIHEMDPNRHAIVDISWKCPIKVNIGERVYDVGSLDKLEHMRLQLQARYYKAQVASKFSKGGHGRAKKLRALDKFNELESNTAKTLAHGLTLEVVKLLVKHQVGKVTIVCNEPSSDENEENKKYQIRNFGYSKIKELLLQKLKKNSIYIE
ncbi:hypothetical protein [Flectobacillus sp. BAB-3569]|uniref:hypothetical protein n=1 Tax=Flectobacillus sp. BAB-3569 TaxID=1509483 RepID=UPI000BA31750|nr:hypothetical protein [Flectobacillus sp. BAB-3569]PAC27760.1 hypothetical protein BWI92_21345 [Flectobacillus sp. BAB-3569]